MCKFVDLVKSILTSIYYLLAEFGLDTDESGPVKVCQNWAKSERIRTNIGNEQGNDVSDDIPRYNSGGGGPGSDDKDEGPRFSSIRYHMAFAGNLTRHTGVDVDLAGCSVELASCSMHGLDYVSPLVAIF